MHFPQCKCDQIISFVGNLPRHPTSLRRETKLLGMASRVLLDGLPTPQAILPSITPLFSVAVPLAVPWGFWGHTFSPATRGF